MGSPAAPLVPTLNPWPFLGSPEEVDVSLFVSADGKGEMSEMNNTGDTKKIWDSKDPISVEAARREFEYFVTENKYAAFAVGKDGLAKDGKDGKPSEPIKVFNASLEKIIYVKPPQGG